MIMKSEVVLAEIEATRHYLATASIGITELVDKAIQLMLTVTENHIIKENV